MVSLDVLQAVRAAVDAKIAAYKTQCAETAAARNRAPAARSLNRASRISHLEEYHSSTMHCIRPARLTERLDFLEGFLDVPDSQPHPPNLKAINLSFAARVMIAVRDKFGGDAPKVYTAAKVSRQAYSQIISDETRPVSKRTAVRFAFALKCSPQEAQCLLKSAGFAFSNSQTEDFILQACLDANPPIWDLDTVNMLLREYQVDFQY